MAIGLDVVVTEHIDLADDLILLGGYIGSPPAWKEFAEEWTRTTRGSGLRDGDGSSAVSMRELLALDDGAQWSEKLFRTIESCDLLPISLRISRIDVDNAFDRISLPSGASDLRFLNDPYVLTYRVLMEQLASSMEQGVLSIFLPTVGPLAFTFDGRSDSKEVVREWNSIALQGAPSSGGVYGAPPVFHNERTSAALQAAAFWLWWRRRWYQNDEETFSFGSWENELPAYCLDFEHSEDKLVVDLSRWLRSRLGPETIVQDRKTGVIL